MRSRVLMVAACAVATLLTVPVGASAETAQAKSCAARADKQPMSAADRTKFMHNCTTGALAPATPTVADTASPTHEITAPSGADRTKRSRQCSTEADKRGLKDSARESFRLSCMASAAPVKVTGTGTMQPSPSPAKSNLGVTTGSTPH